MNFSQFFIKRPIFAAVLSLILLIAGLLAVFKLPISEYPEVVPPTVVVTANYPGANPKVTIVIPESGAIQAETVAMPAADVTLRGADKATSHGTKSARSNSKAARAACEVGRGAPDAPRVRVAA